MTDYIQGFDDSLRESFSTEIPHCAYCFVEMEIVWIFGDALRCPSCGNTVFLDEDDD